MGRIVLGFISGNMSKSAKKTAFYKTFQQFLITFLYAFGTFNIEVSENSKPKSKRFEGNLEIILPKCNQVNHIIISSR